MEAQRDAAFVYQLPRGRHAERGASGAGSGQFAANDFPALPRAGAAGFGEGLV